MQELGTGHSQEMPSRFLDCCVQTETPFCNTSTSCQTESPSIENRGCQTETSSKCHASEEALMEIEQLRKELEYKSEKSKYIAHLKRILNEKNHEINKIQYNLENEIRRNT